MKRYYLKRNVYKGETDKVIIEQIYVCEESFTEDRTYVTPVTLCASLIEIPIEKASKEQIEAVNSENEGLESKQYISKEYAMSLIERFEREGAYTINTPLD
jgi:hypothetical protein